MFKKQVSEHDNNLLLPGPTENKDSESRSLIAAGTDEALGRDSGGRSLLAGTLGGNFGSSLFQPPFLRGQ